MKRTTLQATSIRESFKSNARPQTVTIPLSEILHTLALAVQEKRAWLQDFEDDLVTIPTDLLETLTAFEYFRKAE